MNRVALFLLLVLVAVAIWLLSDDDTSTPRPLDKPATPSSQGGVTRESKGPARAPDSRGRERQRINGREGTGLIGRCIAGEDGRPLPDCQITIYDWPQWSPKIAAHRNAPRSACRSDSAGLFACELLGAKSEAVTVQVRLEGRLPTLLWNVAIAKEAQTTLGDIAVHLGCKVTGFVRDTDGNAVPRFGFSLTRNSEWITAGTGANGAFTLPGLVPPGRFELRSWPRKPKEREVEIPADRRSFQFDVIVPALDRRRSITGKVVLSSGSPIPGANVQAIEDDGLGGKLYRGELSTRTDADGGFCLINPRATPGAETSLLVTVDHAKGLRRGRHETNWGAHGLELVVLGKLSSTSDVRVRVLDGDSRVEIDAFHYRFYCADRRAYAYDDTPNYGRGNLVYDGTHERGGESRPLTGVKGGDYFVSVDPADKTYAPSGPVQLEVPVGQRITKEVLLYKRSELRVTVVTTSGAPVVATSVELIQWPLGKTPFQSTHQAWPVAGVYARGQGLVFSAEKTDPRGQVVLTASPGNYVLRLTGAAHPPMIERNVVLVRGGSIVQVELPTGGTVHGRFEPLAAWLTYWPDPNRPILDAKRAVPQVHFLDLDSKNLLKNLWPLPPVPAIELDRSGMFTAKGVPPGRYRVRVVCLRPNLAHAILAGPEFVVASGAEREVRVPVPRIETAQLSGQIHRNGRPLANAHLSLLTPAPVWRNGYLLTRPVHKLGAPMPVRVSTDAAGKFGPLTVRIGSYSIHDHRGTISRDSVVLSTDQTVSKVFRLQETKLTIRLTTPDGKTAATRPCSLSYKSPDGRVSTEGMVRKTDARGFLQIDRGPQYAFYLDFYQPVPGGPGAKRRARTVTHQAGPLRTPLDRAEAVIDAVIQPLGKRK